MPTLSNDASSRVRDTIASTAILLGWGAITTAAIVMTFARSAAADDIMVTTAAPIQYAVPSPYDWTGFYAGGHLGYAWGSSNWTAPGIAGSFNLSQPVDTFAETGSFFAGLQAGYNYMLPNRVVIGVEADASFPAFPNLAGISIGGTSTFTSPMIGAESYSETVLLPAPCGAVSFMLPETGSFMRQAVSPGLTTNCR